MRSLLLRVKLAVRSPMRSLPIIMPSSAATATSSGVACKNSRQELLSGQAHAVRGGQLPPDACSGNPHSLQPAVQPILKMRTSALQSPEVLASLGLAGIQSSDSQKDVATAGCATQWRAQTRAGWAPLTLGSSS